MASRNPMVMENSSIPRKRAKIDMKDNPRLLKSSFSQNRDNNRKDVKRGGYQAPNIEYLFEDDPCTPRTPLSDRDSPEICDDLPTNDSRGVIMDLSGYTFDVCRVSRGLEVPELPALPGSALSSKVGLVFDKVQLAFRLDYKRRQEEAAQDQTLPANSTQLFKQQLQQQIDSAAISEEFQRVSANSPIKLDAKRNTDGTISSAIEPLERSRTTSTSSFNGEKLSQPAKELLNSAKNSSIFSTTKTDLKFTIPKKSKLTKESTRSSKEELFAVINQLTENSMSPVEMDLPVSSVIIPLSTTTQPQSSVGKNPSSVNLACPISKKQSQQQRIKSSGAKAARVHRPNPLPAYSQESPPIRGEVQDQERSSLDDMNVQERSRDNGQGDLALVAVDDEFDDNEDELFGFGHIGRGFHLSYSREIFGSLTSRRVGAVFEKATKNDRNEKVKSSVKDSSTQTLAERPKKCATKQVQTTSTVIRNANVSTQTIHSWIATYNSVAVQTKLLDESSPGPFMENGLPQTDENCFGNITNKNHEDSDEEEEEDGYDMGYDDLLIQWDQEVDEEHEEENSQHSDNNRLDQCGIIDESGSGCGDTFDETHAKNLHRSSTSSSVKEEEEEIGIENQDQEIHATLSPRPPPLQQPQSREWQMEIPSRSLANYSPSVIERVLNIIHGD